MLQQPLVSMIVPIYNGAVFLRRCMDSILAQTYDSLQVILVNDGSTDESLAICREYAQQDKRIEIIDKENSGVSDSRNRGIAQARGKYLQFVDSDDWLIPEATSLLVEKAEQQQCEMVIAPFYRVVGPLMTVNGHIRTEECISIEKFALQLMRAPANFYYGVMWNKLYRRDIVTAHSLHCDTAISWCEDFIFNLNYLQYVKKVSVLQTPIYYYVKRKDSLVDKEVRVANVYEMKRQVFVHYRNFFEHLGMYETYKGKINGFLVAVTADSLFRLPAGIIDKDEKEIFFADLPAQLSKEHKLLQQFSKGEKGQRYGGSQS